MEHISQVRTAIEGVFRVREAIITHRDRSSQEIQLRGQLLMRPDRAYPYLASYFKALGYLPVLRREEEVDEVLLFPYQECSSPRPPWVAGVMFGLTLLSTLFVGSILVQPVPGVSFTVWGLWRGWPFALSWLSILLAHELGHYLMARHLGLEVSFPYFIPMPFSPFGTLGALIRMRRPFQNRRQVLAMGAAGPLAGLALALPLLVIGLALSEVQGIFWKQGFQEGNSLLYLMLKYLFFRRYLPGGGEDVLLHPVAFAGWAGLLFTGLNLLPVGWLDGGHILRALPGDSAWWVEKGVLLVLTLLGFKWSGWLLWVLVWGFMIAVTARQRYLCCVNYITPLPKGYRLLGVGMILLLLLTFTPSPLAGIG